MDVARRYPLARPWPPYEGKAAALARAKVTDLATDLSLLDRLARELAHWAARWWMKHESHGTTTPY